MTEVLVHQTERRAEIEMSYKYWYGMRLKINSAESKESREMIRIYGRHKRLMATRSNLLAKKTVFNPRRTIQLMRIVEEIDKVNVELNRRREVVSMLRKQIVIACEELNAISAQMENMLFW